MSNYKMYSVGIVSSNKPYGNNWIDVYPMEILPTHDGKLGEVKSNKSNLKSSNGENFSVNVDKSSVIRAEWLRGDGTNRATSPDVVAGETVQIWQYGDSDSYYWSDMGTEFDLRRKEIVLNLYGNTDKLGETLNKDNSYWTLIDTVNKIVQIHTSKNDSEACGYDLTINTKKGIFSLEDTIGNYIKIDSTKGIMDINSNEEINLTTKTFTLEATDSATVTSPDMIHDGNTTSLNTDLVVEKSIADMKGTVTDHQHSVANHSIALPR